MMDRIQFHILVNPTGLLNIHWVIYVEILTQIGGRY